MEIRNRNIIFEVILKLLILSLIIIILILVNILPIYVNGSNEQMILSLLFGFIISLIINISWNEIEWIFHYIIVIKINDKNEIKTNLLKHNIKSHFSTYKKLFKLIFKNKLPISFIIIIKLLSLLSLFISAILISLSNSDTGLKIGTFDFCSWSSESLRRFYSKSAINQINKMGGRGISAILWENVAKSYTNTLYRSEDGHVKFYQFNTSQTDEAVNKALELSPRKIIYIDQPSGTIFGLITICNSNFINSKICETPNVNSSLVDNINLLKNFNLGDRGTDTIINNSFMLYLNLSYDNKGYPILSNISNIYRTEFCENIEMQCLIGGGNYINKRRNRLGVIDTVLGSRSYVEYIDSMSDVFSGFMQIMFNYSPINLSEFTNAGIIISKSILQGIPNNNLSYSASMEPFLQVIGVLSNEIIFMDENIEKCNQNNVPIISTNGRPSGILTIITIILLILPTLSIVIELIWVFKMNEHIAYLWLQTNNVTGWLFIANSKDSPLTLIYDKHIIKFVENKEI